MVLTEKLHRPSVWCSKYYVFYNFTKIKIKSFELPKSIRNYEKNNAWLMSRLSHQPSKPGIFGLLDFTFNVLLILSILNLHISEVANIFEKDFILTKIRIRLINKLFLSFRKNLHLSEIWQVKKNDVFWKEKARNPSVCWSSVCCPS